MTISILSSLVVIVSVHGWSSEKKSACPARIEKAPTRLIAAIDSASPSKYSFVGDRAITDSGDIGALLNPYSLSQPAFPFC